MHSAILKEEVDQPYRMLYDLTAIDERMRVHRDGQPASDFTVVYHLLSFDRNEYVRIKVALKRDQPPIDTVTDLWPAANWYEREVWDMFGIAFDGHPHLGRILMPKTWVGHPLRRTIPRERPKWARSNCPTKSRMRSRKRCASGPKIGACSRAATERISCSSTSGRSILARTASCA